jgi:hypothetical protein
MASLDFKDNELKIEHVASREPLSSGLSAEDQAFLNNFGSKAEARVYRKVSLAV